MMYRTRIAQVFLAFASLLLLVAAGAIMPLGSLLAEDDPGKASAKTEDDKNDLNILSMEVSALKTLRNIRATPSQLEALARIAKTTSTKERARDTAKADPNYIKALKDLHEALVKDDQSQVDTLQEKANALEESNPPDLDVDFEISDAARQETDRFLMKTLSIGQIAAYIGSYGEDFPDPVQLVLEGLEMDRKLQGDEWTDARNDLAEEVTWLVTGSRPRKAEKIKKALTAFLNQEHDKKDSPKNADLANAIRGILEIPGPFAIMKNRMEHDLVKLLSNPRLEMAANACLQNGAK